jgi:hypothetical protein
MRAAWVSLSLFATLYFGFPMSAIGNDGSAISTPAGGIQLRREARISMEKERLTISEARITVEYEFLNETDQDVTTEVAFPMPAYPFLLTCCGYAEVEGFRVQVDGMEVKYQTQIRALLDGKDYANEIRRIGIDPESFGMSVDAGTLNGPPKAKLDALVRQRLSRKDGFPLWEIEKTHYWTQTFPAHHILRVKHEYKPVQGLEHLDADALRGQKSKADSEMNADLKTVCLDPPLRNRLIAAAPYDNGFVEGLVDGTWVDYVLRTANTWKTPIKQFELVIERPKPRGGEHYYVSLCWDGKLEPQGPDAFVSWVANFIPRRELRVMFFQVGK